MSPVASAVGAPLLEIRGLTVDYGEGPGAVHAVDNVDLVLHRSETLGLAGESGSGKSTLAHAVTRLLRPPGTITGGQVLYHRREGKDAAGHVSDGPARSGPVNVLDMTRPELRAFRWEEIAIVFQSAMNALNPVHTVLAQIADTLKAHRPGITRAECRERAAHLLTTVGVPAARMSAYAHELSGGMRQRVMIAMALALDPEILVLDEPTTALDVVVQREVLAELVRLREEFGFSVLFITHDLSLLLEVADRVAIMYAGRVIESAPAEEVYRDPVHPYTRGLVASFPPLRGPRRELAGIGGSPPDLRALPPGCAFSPRCRHAFDRCTRDLPLLRRPAGAPERLVACHLDDPNGSADDER
ncbi:ABC transporter ATP-binding protein [Yinghuangia seranimata]|uniref:ABC transporter ATP-binding protein n=1 Tax=Yinghuangia seranimata TaxID=408067 RepID=UPI00248BDD86|nr:ABC transporter ATP-binding protein [Yinghuangia seranimata]MDI2126075.1 ABC transporter ATP-binding protein [Yinghuangia seranimata]